MDTHALNCLNFAEGWNWPLFPGTRDCERHETNTAGVYKDASRNFLLGLIAESHLLGGTLSERFWSVVKKCHPKFAENVEELRGVSALDQSELESLLFDGIRRGEINFNPVFELSNELFVRLGIAFMNSNEHEFIPFNARGDKEQVEGETMKLVLQRDGTSCLITGIPFYQRDTRLIPVLIHIIPPSVLEKSETLDLVALLAGDTARETICESSQNIGNFMSLEANAAAAYQRGEWAIEAHYHDGSANETKYVFRALPDEQSDAHGLLIRDGDEIAFGRGPEEAKLDHGPNPVLCNLHLSIARALSMSGAREMISQLMRDADDAASPHTSDDENFGEILSAKLLISGRAIAL